MDNDKICFTATIIKHPGLDASYVEFPFDVIKLFGKKGQVKVKVVFDKTVIYRGSLANMGLGCHVLGITKDIRSKLNKTFGDFVEVELEQDLEIREVIIPQDVKAIFTQNPASQSFFDSLSYTNRKEYIVWIESAKKEETRIKRLAELQILLHQRKKWSEK
jgi:hypothetical protein